jgi:hypothetical protein
MLRVGTLLYTLETAVQRYPTVANMLADVPAPAASASPDEPVALELPNAAALPRSHLDWLFADAEFPLGDLQLDLLAAIDWLDGWALPRTAQALIGAARERVAQQAPSAGAYPSAVRAAWLDTLDGSSGQLELTARASAALAEPLLVPVRRELPSALAALLPPPELAPSRWCVAGGAVLNALLGEARADSDLDVFVLDEDVGALGALIEYYTHWARDRGLRALAAQRHRLLTLAIENQPLVQLILTEHRSPFDLVLGFDVAPAQCFWHAQHGCVVASQSCLESLRDRVIRDYRPHLRRARYEKYKARGFTFQPEPRCAQAPDPDSDQAQAHGLDWALGAAHVAAQLREHAWGRDGVWPLGEYAYAERNLTGLRYWWDNASREVRASQLPPDWYEHLERAAPVPTHGGSGPDFERLTYRGRTVVFELEPMRIMPAVSQCFEIASAPEPGEPLNPARAADTLALLVALEHLHREWHCNAVIKRRDFSEWRGSRDDFFLRLKADKEALRDAHGERIANAWTRAHVFIDVEVFAAAYAERRCQCRVALSGRLRWGSTGIQLRLDAQRVTLLE